MVQSINEGLHGACHAGPDTVERHMGFPLCSGGVLVHTYCWALLSSWQVYCNVSSGRFVAAMTSSSSTVAAHTV